MNRISVTLLAVCVASVMARGETRSIKLEFAPDGAPDATPDSAGFVAAIDQTVALRLADARSGNDPNVVGTETTADGEVVGIRSADPVPPFVNRAFQTCAHKLGIPEAPDSDLVLEGKLRVLNGMIQGRSGRMLYTANVRIAFALHNRTGSVLWSGLASGDASQFGPQSGSAELNHAISNALVEAFGALFDNKELHGALAGSAAVAVPEAKKGGATVSSDDLLTQLEALRKKGTTVDAMIEYTSDKTLSAELDVFQIARWKNDGIPERLIRAVLDRPVVSE